MKISRGWLQTYFEKPLPDLKALADALTFHVAEIEEVGEGFLDVKVLPDRAAYLLSHRGIAKELSAILGIPLKRDPLREPIPEFPKTDKLVVSVDDTYVNRHIGALVKGVKVGPSPAWLTEALEAVGQRSINNVVDSTNYVMLNLGQPTHAFDAGKIAWSGDVLKIDIRSAKEGEKMQILSGEEYTLTPDMFVIADATSGNALDLAGLKGGLASGITDTTTDLFVSVGNYDGTLIRKMSQKLKLFTDASQRFQNRPSPELCVYGMRDLLQLLAAVAGGEVVGVIDVYPHQPEMHSLETSAKEVSAWLGATYSDEQLSDVFAKLDFAVSTVGDVFTVTPPFERRDIVISQDIAEEVGRIIGYDKIPATELAPIAGTPDQSRWRGIERMKDMLVEQGFVEVSTQSFTKKGEVELANPLDKTRPALRPNLEGTLNEALEKAKLYAPLLLAPNEKPKLFEVGTVFPKEGEFVALQMTERVPAWGDAAGTSDNLSFAKLEDYGKEYTPKHYALGPYQPFSIYPFALRDVAFWCLEDTSAEDAAQIVRESAKPLLVRIDLFDTFKKDTRVSYAFRLVLQTFDHTLSDDEITTQMKTITNALGSKGWEVR